MKVKLIFDTDELEKDNFMPADEETDILNIKELQDKDIYTEEGIMARLEDDGINSSEQGFMLGWITA
ncbi:hypothetical protein KY304_02605 [Candidatus Woesearchaeota archaeon]|nr:hypothetical protein [Candidatus Woesearchaeota archaeon]MBW2978977.1 hypothetical protein [Candidatus Woesearchaeota archaeon]